MPLRDLAITAVIMGLVPLIFWRPYIGTLLWTWVSMMNPHRLTYGFAYSFPFAQIIAICTLVTLPFTGQRKRFPLEAIPVLLVVLMMWMSLTSLYALNEADAVYLHWVTTMKTYLMLLVTMILIRGRRQIDQLIWVIVFSVGYYGVKGGVFTVLTGGEHRVLGPPGSYIEGNNELALATVMLVPLMYYLYRTTATRWVRYLLVVSMVACGFSIVGSHSRGALLAMLGGAAFLALKSRRPALTGLIVAIGVAGMIAFMPVQWSDRMGTITNYESDLSAQSRLRTWETIWNLAKDRPMVGGGFDLATPNVYQLYSPIPDWTDYSPHSIYFQALGEHGFVGLALFLILAIATWRRASQLARKYEESAGYDWVPVLMRMIQVSLVGFGIGGAFLGLLHYDLPYYMATLVVLVSATVREEESVRVTAVEPHRATTLQA